MNFLVSATFAADSVNNIVVKTGKGGDIGAGFFLIDDGMAKDAGSHYVSAFVSWFHSEIACGNLRYIDFASICTTWKYIYSECNDILRKSSVYSGIHASSLAFFVVNDRYCLMRCGDINLFKVCDSEVNKVTPCTDKDSILGTTSNLIPEWSTGYVKLGEVYLLCTESFSHDLEHEAIRKCLSPNMVGDPLSVKMRLNHLNSADYRSSAVLLKTY